MMSAVQILFVLGRDGLTVTLEGENLRVGPSSALTPALRQLIGANKAAIVSLLANAHQTSERLLIAIQMACDARGDKQGTRMALIEECKRLQPHEQADMREHFEQEAKRGRLPGVGQIADAVENRSALKTKDPPPEASGTGTGDFTWQPQ